MCSRNDVLCGNGNYCYLSALVNDLVFQNNTQGVQDAHGVFYCPVELPFAVNVTVANSGIATPIVGSSGNYQVVIGYSSPQKLTSVSCTNQPVYMYKQ